MSKRILGIVMALAAAAIFFVVPAGREPSVSVSTPAGTPAESSGTQEDLSETTPSESTPAATTAAVSSSATTAKETEPTPEETTTPSAPADAPTVSLPAETPLEEHGALSVSGRQIVDKDGDIFQLKGLSTHGLTWFPDIVSEAAFRTLRDDWNCNAVRLSMYVDEWGNDLCYLKNPDQSIALVEKGVEICTGLGMYVVIDWHVLNPGDPAAYTEEAVDFFDYVSEKYSSQDNVIYEICNEPNGGNIKWESVIKPYCEEVISAIRENDPDAIIIVGTGTWSQDIHDAAEDRLSDENTVYALHFYADTHRRELRRRLSDCYDEGLPVIVSEFGNCDASGGGANNLTEAAEWLTLLDEFHIGYFNWSLSNKDETCSVFRPGTDLASGNWPDSALTESGEFIKRWYTGG